MIFLLENYDLVSTIATSPKPESWRCPEQFWLGFDLIKQMVCQLE
jgi:hypothetical protein